MTEQFAKMSTEELKKFKLHIQNELDDRENKRKQEILKREEANAEFNLSKIDEFLNVCSHSENNKCSDDNINDDVYSSHRPDDVRCIRCYLLSCKRYNVPPNFKISLMFESYELFGRD